MASGDCKGAFNENSCVKNNCLALVQYKIDANKCQSIINQCVNTYIVGNGSNQTGSLFGFRETGNTEQGSCSNALRSCFENEVNTDACSDKDVLALATGCNDGNVNADGDCGMDKAIQEHNELDGGTDYAKNSGLKEDYINQQVDDACKNAADTEALKNCQNAVRDRANACYDKNGGTSTKTDTTKITQCMIEGATTSDQCTAAGGTWIGGTDGAQAARCAPPTQVGQCQGHGGVDPKDSTKCADGTKKPDDSKAEGAKGSVEGPNSQCGTVKTNLIGCTKNGEAGQAIGDLLKIVVSVLTVIIGIAATGGLAWAAILYAKAEDIAGNVSEAKTLIRNIVIGILLYGFMVAIVNWLVPGGVIG